MPDKEGIADEFDTPWKAALEVYLRPFLELCFPAVHALIDWRYTPEFLDTELQQLGPGHAQGPRAVDRLVKVRLLDGHFEWLLIHVEVQAQRQSGFPQRMWTYYYRIWDKFGQRVVSLAVLADDDPAWRPRAYETAAAGCRLRFEFPVFKVIDLLNPERIFADTGNPFALVIAAHQSALATKRNPESRYQRRFQLLRQLSEKGMEPQKARELWKVIHILTRLPRHLELKFKVETANVPTMSIKDLITPLEQIAMEEGEAKGRRQAVMDALEARFGTVAADISSRLDEIEDLAQLRQLLRFAVTEPSVAQFVAKL